MADIKPVVKKKKSKKLLLFSIIGVVIILIIVAVVASGNKDKLVTVQTEKVIKRNVTQVVSGTGTINPETKVDISAEISGEIVQLPYKEGDTVKKGDLLVKIKAETYGARINQQQAGVQYSRTQVEVAENNLKKAQLELQRTEQLFQSGLVSQSDLDNARIAYDVAVSNVKSSNANVRQNQALLQQSSQDLSKATIRSNMDGIVTAMNNELGEKVVGTQQMAGTVIMTVSDLSVMDAEIEISETDITSVKLGDTAEVEVDAFPERIIKGYVYEISNSAKSKGTGTQEQVINFIVKIRIIDQDVQLKPGMSCNADIKVNSKSDVITIPIQSVTAREDEKTDENSDEEVKRKSNENLKKKEKPKEVVFVVEEGSPTKVKIVQIKTGISDDRYIEILEGLQPDQVVVKGPYKSISKELEEGSVVKIDNEIKKKTDKEE
ncbi:MAG TPA: efflux RND transporter periplasmic adaptor subunit [Ignavibacteria bacterium]|nr:efflux RND transporter periplasmic adaptor subunit [Ignavibacteria bacterium]HAX49304.1 efflux RND transporter periplasmic adaptor subunit [Bacteroidota bacterium]HRE10284.1 efflux RND transporter periplasmic adaptor subunit [Ignavibacteria bacterium]HRF67092.1 efflux RND transporter periplasmic adaptor subunit [Ignavibacteria bacterium]HRJ05166.1 efflux RND transporter periplasmic adaptor subunit [Ignavibacteria bacterium]